MIMFTVQHKIIHKENGVGNHSVFLHGQVCKLLFMAVGKRYVILSGAQAESKNLRIWSIFAVKLVPGSLASHPRDDNTFCFLMQAAIYLTSRIYFFSI